MLLDTLKGCQGFLSSTPQCSFSVEPYESFCTDLKIRNNGYSEQLIQILSFFLLIISQLREQFPFLLFLPGSSESHLQPISIATLQNGHAFGTHFLILFLILIFLLVLISSSFMSLYHTDYFFQSLYLLFLNEPVFSNTFSWLF